MKKLLFLLLFIPLLCSSQRLIVNGFRYTSGTSRTFQIYLATLGGPTMSEPNWYKFTGITTFLTDNTGTISTIQLAISGDAIQTDTGWGAPSPNTTSFPADAALSEFYINSGQNVAFAFSGLNNAKNYTIKTMHYDPGAGNPTTITINGTTQSVNPNNNASEIVFTGISPTSGVITVNFGGSAGNPVMNAIKFIEN